MAEGIDDTAQAPAVIFGHWIDLRSSGGQGARENCIRIGHSQNDADRAPAECLRTEVAVLGRLVAHPELCALYGKPRDDAVSSVHAKYFRCSECGLIKLDGFGAIANGEPGCDG